MRILDNTNGHQKAINEKVDYNIHGLVGIRLIHPSASDIVAVDKQLGPMRGNVEEPDITIRFVNQIPTVDLVTLAVDRAGFDKSGFYILQSKKNAAKVRVPFDQIGGRCEILCESGLKAVPLLIAIINLTLLNKGALALHASAFVHRNKGILVTGWSKGGKTEALLAFAKAGAEYVGDEWVVLSPGGDMMYGIPEPIRVWQWHLNEYPVLRQFLSRTETLTFKAINLLSSLTQRLEKSRWKKSFLAQVLRKAMPALSRQLGTNIPPHKIFKQLAFGHGVQPDQVILILSHQKPDIEAHRLSGSEIAERMIHSLQYEMRPLLDYYDMYRYAFPEGENNILVSATKRQRDLLVNALKDKDSFCVKRPHPVSFDELYLALDRVITEPKVMVA